MGIRVLLVDDHTVVRQGLRRMLELEEDMEVVAEAANGEEALDKIPISSPDVILMDIRMPGMDGIEAIRQVKERYPEKSVIALTLYGEQYLAPAIEAGAVGYLVKDVGNEELIGAIRAVQQGKSILHPSLSREFFNEFATLAKGNSRRCCLSPRELEIMRLVSTGATTREIAAQLFLSSTTVKRGLSRIFEKLVVKDRAEAVAEAYRRGLL